MLIGEPGKGDPLAHPRITLIGSFEKIAAPYVGFYIHAGNKIAALVGISDEVNKDGIDFKKLDEIPFDLIGELSTKLSVDEWINIYESL